MILRIPPLALNQRCRCGIGTYRPTPQLIGSASRCLKSSLTSSVSRSEAGIYCTLSQYSLRRRPRIDRICRRAITLPEAMVLAGMQTAPLCYGKQSRCSAGSPDLGSFRYRDPLASFVTRTSFQRSPSWFRNLASCLSAKNAIPSASMLMRWRSAVLAACRMRASACDMVPRLCARPVLTGSLLMQSSASKPSRETISTISLPGPQIEHSF